jgi:hypothetical protein
MKRGSIPLRGCAFFALFSLFFLTGIRTEGGEPPVWFIRHYRTGTAISVSGWDTMARIVFRDSGLIESIEVFSNTGNASKTRPAQRLSTREEPGSITVILCAEDGSPSIPLITIDLSNPESQLISRPGEPGYGLITGAAGAASGRVLVTIHGVQELTIDYAPRTRSGSWTPVRFEPGGKERVGRPESYAMRMIDLLENGAIRGFEITESDRYVTEGSIRGNGAYYLFRKETDTGYIVDSFVFQGTPAPSAGNNQRDPRLAEVCNLLIMEQSILEFPLLLLPLLTRW